MYKVEEDICLQWKFPFWATGFEKTERCLRQDVEQAASCSTEAEDLAWDKTAGEMRAGKQSHRMGEVSKKEKGDTQGWKAEGLTLKDTQLCK